MTGEPKSASIKTKIMVGFSLVICGVLFVGFIAYKSFNLLVNSIDQISQPDIKLTLLNRIVRDIAEAEVILRESTLRSGNASLEPFFVYTDSVNSRLDSLRVLFENEAETLVMLDSITILINEKLQGADGYVKLYSRKKKTDYYKKAINEITAKEIASPEIDTGLLRDEQPINIDSAIQVLDSITNRGIDKKKKGFLRSRKKKREDSIKLAEEQAKTRAQIEMVLLDEINKSKEKDELITPAQSAVVTDTVTKIITNIKREEQRSEYAITQKELEIIENNSLILNQVKFLINEMESHEAYEHRQNTIKAQETANDAIMTIIGTGILGTFSGIMFIYILFNDITKRNYYRRLLIKAREKAINEAKAKEDFLANMSHEIRTPLNAILGFSEQLSNTSLEKTQDEYLKAIRSSSSHLLATVNDVLDFSKIQANKLSIEEIPFKLINVIKDVYATLKLKAEQKNIELRYSFDENLNQVLAGDPFRLKQILLNLVNNGIKFTHEGYVEIKAVLEKEFKTKVIARIEVNDSGIGIAKENIHKIFEGFSQSDSSTTRKYGGTGLGLTISKKLVELQGGTMEVNSEVNKGSSFIVTLTFKKGKDFKPLPRESTLPFNGSQLFSEYKVIVIDDDKLNLHLTEIIFTRWGLNADFVIDGKEAIKKIEEHAYHLIITDIQMPEFSGIDLAKHVRGLQDPRKSKTTILAFTANVMKDDIRKYLDSGINDYLLKPFKEAHLFNKIAGALKIEIENVAETNGQHKGQKDKPQDTSKQPLYDLSEILQFTGERNESLLEVLESFVNNTKNSLLMMDSGLKNRDWDKVSMMGHKMLPSFQHLKVTAAIPLLKKLEGLDRGNASASEITPLVQKVETIAKTVIKALKKEIILLKQELSTKQLP